MISDLVKDFIKDYSQRAQNIPIIKERDSVTTREEFVNMLSEVEMLLRKNKDKSVEEIIELIIKDNILYFEDIRKKYGVPGYTASIKVGNTNVKLYGGNINYLGEPMPENALFDIASMTKFYTQIVAYNLIKEGVFKRSDKISDLDSRFVSLEDLTVDEILTFSVEFRTPGRISDKKTINEALDTLYHVYINDRGKWNYNDMGMMIMKELMENLTGLSYVELVNKYIVNPLGLKDTHIIVPQSKYHLLTGSPNASVGHINDMTANAVGGYSGHAGIFASSDDVVKMMLHAAEARSKILPNNEDAYTPGKYRDSVGVMGNVYVPHRTGIYESFVDTLEPNDTFAIAGSTRTNAAANRDSAYSVLFNPGSMSIDEAKERVAKINEDLVARGKNPINPVRQYEFDRNGKLIKLDLIDPRMLFPVDPMATAVQTIAHTTLKLRFLEYILRRHENMLEEINVNKNVR